jgi:hypothetical protein
MTRHELLLACYRSGQMSYPQLAQHMRDDATFAAYVRAQA